MNIIELENLVKGFPDDQLIKEVQAPSGQIPQFLALSEVQRRKDMRDRYQAQQNGGQKPTIAEQIVGGGIGSLPGAEGAQGASIPTPSATGIPSAGAPPVADGAAPLPTPPGMPQGFAKGGQVGYAEGGSVTPRGSEVQRRKPLKEYNVLEAFRAQSPEYYDAIKSIADIPLGAYFQANNMLNSAINFDIPGPQDLAERIRKDNERYGPKEDNRSLTERLKAKDAERASVAQAMDMAKMIPQTGVKDYNYSNPAVVNPGAGPVLAMSSPSAPSLPVSRPASSGARPAPPVSRPEYAVAPGGIGSINPNEAVSGGAGVAPAVSVPSQAPEAVAGAPAIPNPYNVSSQELALQQYLENNENFKLPEAMNYQAFINEAMGEEQAIRAEAKKQALGAALVQLGAGLAAGDMAKGLTTAGAESRDILSQGRREASAQKALAQQFKLKGMEGERDVKLKQMEMDIKRTESLATLVGGNRRDAEAKAMQIAELSQRAADRAATLGVSLKNHELSAKRYELEKKQNAIQFMEGIIDTSVGKPPTQSTLEAWATASRMNPATAGPNPMDTYMAQRAEAAKLAAPKVEQVYGISAKNLYIDAVKPDSNTGKTKIQQGRFIVEY